MQCAVCGNGIIAKYEGAGVPNWITMGQPGHDIRLLGIWPKREVLESPKDIPKNVENFFMQAKGSAQRAHWDAAGAMFRKSLDVSLRQLNPNGKGTIYDRIESLPDSAGVTTAMKQWAHAIRRLGADAAHDEDAFTEQEAKTLQVFTEMFLTYAFSLPALLKASQPPAVS
jgi:hypothetical protein